MVPGLADDGCLTVNPGKTYTRLIFPRGLCRRGCNAKWLHRRACDLKKLVSAQDVLGVGSLPGGHYTQIRLTVSAAALYFDNAASGACADTIAAPAGNSAAMSIPSGVIKLNREFTVPTGGTTTILVDFDGDKSVHDTGNGHFMMSPVISGVSVS